MDDLPEPSANEQAEHGHAWDDATLEAEHWFDIPVGTPTAAAMLLCQYNPNDEDTPYEVAVHCTNSETGPRELVQLKQRFEALNTVEPCERSLHDWLKYARSQNIRHHSWIDRYADALPAPAKTPAPVVAAAVELADGAPEETSKPAVPNWKMQIQAEATAHVLRLRKFGCNPTRHSILDDLATWCINNNVRTDTGIHPRASYLRTHVLGGKHWDVPN